MCIYMHVPLLSLDLTTGQAMQGVHVVFKFSYHVTDRSSLNVISCKVFIDINVIGNAKTA